MTGEFISIGGACHCGNIRFALGWPAAVSTVPVRACGCTFCQKHGGAWTSHPDATLEARVRDPDGVSRYRFGTKTADFHVCSVCGVVPYVTSEIDGRLFAVVSVPAFESVDGLSFDRAATDFDGEDTDSRLGRRQRHWIGDVRITESRAGG